MINAGLPLREAVDRAVRECIREGVLEEFLRKNRAETIQVSIFEYDEEQVMKVIRQDEREIGRQEGIETGRQEGIEIGKQEGIAAGQQQKLKELVSRKLEKGKGMATIAEELEEPLENVRKIYEELHDIRQQN